jgi:hypothetical protein
MPTSTFRLLPLLLALFAAAPAFGQLNAQEQQIANLLTHASGQQRPFVEVDPILSRVARARAMDLAKRNYFAHVNPDGHGANYLVRQAGYPLPAGYDQSPSGNNIESIAAGDSTAAGAWSLWMGSAPHKRHLLAQDPFYTAQTSLGVGYYYDANSDYKHYWVVITAPPPGPSLAIATPAANAGLTADQTTVAGTSGGLPAAARVVWRLENADGVGAFRDASGTTSWSASVAGLIPGANTVRVRTLDSGGGTIKELARTFRFVVLKPLVVSIEGSGTVTAGFLGTSQRELAARTTVTATPAAGWLFDHWSGSVDSSTAALAFTMAEGFTLTAHFRPNPFYALKGAYNGLIQADTAAQATSGFLKLTTAVTGAFSGRLTLGGRGYAVLGKFDATGAAQLTISRASLPPLTVTLQLDLTGGTQQITGSIADGTFTAAISADQALPSTARHFAAGRYTLALPANPADGTAPQGAGSVLLVVSPAGAATFSGTLADGRAFTGGATVSKNGDLPIYVPLLGGTGSLAGHAIFNADTGEVAGTIFWSKPERPADRYFRAAFHTTVDLVGARYTAPRAGVTAIEVAATLNNSALQLTGGDLQTQVDQTATLLPTNLVAIVHPQLPKLTVAITASTGRFTGSFIHPITKLSSRITGVILQDRNAATGFFLGQAASGAALFAPAQ